MPRIDFSKLPDHGRLWVFPASRDLDAEARAATLRVVDDFLDGWAAHGAPLRSGRELVEGRFLLVGVDVDAEAPSGCSIDALVRRIREHGDAIDARFIDHAPIWYRDDQGVIKSVSRAAFRALSEAGEVTADTPVFDTSLTTLAALREGRLEGPARDSWHGRVYFREQVAG